MSGTLYAVGVGPGDPDLMTVKAVRLIQSAALIAYPLGQEGKRSLARQIAAPFIPKASKEFGFSLPMRLERTPAKKAYDDAALIVSETLQAGQDVVLLCEGDPFFYGSAMYMVERVASQFPCEIIPGITSLTACAAAIRRPLAGRNDCLKVLPAPMEEARLKQELASCEAAAIIKIGRHFDKIRHLLQALDLVDQAIIIEKATDKNQQVTQLKDMPAGAQPYFSTILLYKGGEAWEFADAH